MIDDFGELRLDVLLSGCLTKVGKITRERNHALTLFVFLALFVKATTNTDENVTFLPSNKVTFPSETNKPLIGVRKTMVTTTYKPMQKHKILPINLQS